MTDGAVVIGASAGGVHAVCEIVASLPVTYSLPVVIVIHSAPGPDAIFVDVLQERSQLPVKEVEEKEPLQAGTVYVAARNYHVLVEEDKTFSLSVDHKVVYSRPSIDVLFESMAEVYGTNLVAVLLTGANHDGSQGTLAVREYGGVAIVQEPKDAEVAIMPQAAIDLGGADYIEPLSDIAVRLSKLG